MDEAQQQAETGREEDGKGREPGDQADSQPRLRNPFRSEADAFRLLVIIAIAIAIIVVAAKLGGPWVGVPVAVVVVAVGVRACFRWLSVALSEREPQARL